MEGLLWTKCGLEIRGDNAPGYCHFSPDAQEHIMVLTVLAWRSSTSLAGHVTFLSAKCSRDFFAKWAKRSIAEV